MAAKVNKKFLLTFIAVFGVAVIVILSVLMIQFRQDATRNIRAGDEAMEENDFRRAKEQYGRAVNKEATNLEYLSKFETALLGIEPNTTNESRELYREYIQILQHAAAHHPKEASHHLRLLDELYNLAKRSGDSVVWTDLTTRAKNMWDHLPSTDSDRIYAKFFLGASKADPSASSHLTEEERAEGILDLKSFLAEVPNDDRGWATLLDAQLMTAQWFHRGGQPRRAEQETRMLIRMRDDAVAAVPDGLRTLIADLKIAKFLHTTIGDEDSVEEIAQKAHQLADAVSDVDDTFLVQEAAFVLHGLDWVEDRPNEMELLDSYLAKHPNRIPLYLVKARIHHLNAEVKEAAESANRILAAPVMKTSMMAQLQFEMQRQAADLLLDVDLVRLEEATGAERADAKKAVQTALDRLTSLAADPETDPLVLRGKAKAAFAERDFRTASKLLETLIRNTATPSVDVLILAAEAMAQIQQYGPAEAHLKSAIEQLPNNEYLLGQLAEIYVIQLKYDEARRVLTTIERVNPNNSKIDDLRDRMIVQDEESIEKAIDPVVAVMQEMQDRILGGDLDAAAQALAKGLEKHQYNERLMNARVLLYVKMDRFDQARTALDQLEAAHPDFPNLKMLRELADSEDPIGTLGVMYREQYPDDHEFAAVMYMELHASARNRERTAGTAEATGQMDTANRDRAVAAQAMEAAKEYEEKALQLPPSSPLYDRLIDFRFTQAIASKEWDVAEQMVQLAAKNNTDQANGQFYQGHLHFARNEPEGAVRAFQSVTQVLPHYAPGWRGLAEAYERVGNYPRALESFEIAYNTNSNDITTAMRYASLLKKIDNNARALQVLQKAYRLDPYNIFVRNEWLLLEESTGNLPLVLSERRRVFSQNKRDGENAAQLTRILSTHTPTRRELRDERGREIYSRDAWTSMREEERKRIIEETRQRWYREAIAVIEGMIRPEERDLLWYRRKSEILELQGRLDEAEQTLRDFIRVQTDRETKLHAMVALGNLMARNGRMEGAKNILNDAKGLQSDGEKLVEASLGSFLHNAGRYSEAVKFLEEVRSGDARPEQLLVLVECYVQLDEYDKAREVLEETKGKRDRDVSLVLLEASITDGEAVARAAAGNRNESMRLNQRVEELITEAERLDPTSPQPYLIRAQRQIHKYNETKDPTRLENALLEVSKAETLQAGLTEASFIRAKIRLMQEDVRGAISELTRLLEREPENDKARDTLVQLHLANDDKNRAVEVIKAGSDLNPGSAYWPELLGNVYVAHFGDPMAAAEWYKVAVARAPTNTATVIKLANTLLAANPPANDAVLDMAYRNRQAFQTEPSLLEAFARANYGTNRIDEARQQMAEAYRMRKQRIREIPDRFDESTIRSWYTSLGMMLQSEPIEQIDQFVSEVTAGEMGLYDLWSLAQFWFRSGSGGRSQAIVLLNQAVELCPADDTNLHAQLQKDLGEYLLVDKQFNAAETAFRQAHSVLDDDPFLLNNYAYLLSEGLNNPQKALSIAKRATELAPDSASILDTLGVVHLRLGELDEAVLALRKASDMDEQPTTLFHLAQAYLAKGSQDDRNRAMRYLEKAAELNPDPELRSQINRLADDIRNMNQAR